MKRRLKSEKGSKKLPKKSKKLFKNPLDKSEKSDIIISETNKNTNKRRQKK